MALVAPLKKTEPSQFTCADGVLLFGSMLEIFNGQLEKAANRYDASLVCECILAGCSYLPKV